MSSSYASYLPTACPHRALETYDILYTIFDQLLASEDAWFDYDPSVSDRNVWWAHSADAPRRRTLARCARVCRAFFTPAVAALWREVDTLSPLISALRTSGRSSCDLMSQHHRFAEPRARAFQYARHVRVVHAIGRPLQPPELDFLAGLSPEKRVAPTPLPQLKHLRWRQPIPGDTTLLQIIPSSLCSLHIIFTESPTRSDSVALHRSPSEYEVFCRDLLKKVAARAPRLQYLRVSVTGDIQESWLEPSCHLKTLETVDFLGRIYCKVTTSPLLRPLSLLPKLQHLKLRLQAEIPSEIGSDAFPSLRTLTIDAMFAPLRTVSAFLSTITSPHLHTLIIQGCECNATAIGAKLHEVCDVVRSRFAPSLRTLELSLRGVGPVVADTQPLIRTIEPLLDIHDLDDFSLSIAPEVAVIPASEHDLEKMAEAWPKATRLHLSYFPSAAAPSLKDVAEFAQRCSGLTDLVLPAIDASTSRSRRASNIKGELGIATAPFLPALAPDCKAQKSAHKLRSLCLSDSGRNSRIPDPAQLAEFLDALFPQVEWKCPPLASEHWRETIQEVVNLRVMRILRETGTCSSAS